MKKIISIIILVVVFSTVILLTSNSEKDTIEIGAVLSLTGDASVDGENIKKGIEFARKDLLKQGIDLKVTYEDDQTQPAKTVSSVKKIHDVDGIDVIIGPTWSFLSSAAAATIQDNKIVSYNPANTSEFVETPSDYFLFGAPRNALKEGATADWLNEIGAKKVAIVVEQGAWGNSHIGPFTNAVNSVGGSVVLNEIIPYGATGQDIQSLVAKIKNYGADAVLFTGYDASTAIFVNKIQEINTGLPSLIATEIVRSHQQNGVVNVSDEDNVYMLGSKQSEEFGDKFNKEYGYYPGSYTDRAYDGTIMLAKAMAEKPEGVELNDYVREMKYEGYMGTYEFDENNDLIGGEWVVNQIK